MTEKPSSDVIFSDTVKAFQEKMGSRALFERLEAKGGFQREILDNISSFIGKQDSFYFATAGADGQPHVQHRGGPKGFLKVLDATTLAFADFSGNQQYVSAGNITENPKVQVFLMDYPNRTRIKVFGTARVVEDDPALIEQLAIEGYEGIPERAIVIDVQAWDANCPKHITRRYTEDQIEKVMAKLDIRIHELEAEIVRLGGKV